MITQPLVLPNPMPPSHSIPAPASPLPLGIDPRTSESPIDTAPGFHLAAVVLLAGSVRQTELARAAGRSRLDLPVRPGVTLGDCWSQRIADLRLAIGQTDLPMVIASNSIARSPRTTEFWPGAVVRMDSEEPRGSGGALRDIAEKFAPQDRLLVAPAHAYPRECAGALASLLTQLAACPADAVVHTDEASSPTGFFLFRCAALAALPARGFVDLKEQALPTISSRMDVRVVRTAHPAPLPVRTLDGYIRVLRAAAGSDALPDDPPIEDWRCTFALAEQGAAVHPSARLHDAVVLEGARVGAGAVVVRSLVGPGGVVSAGEAVFDELVGAGDAP